MSYVQDFTNTGSVRAYQHSSVIQTSTEFERQKMTQLVTLCGEAKKAPAHTGCRIRNLEPDTFTDVAGKVWLSSVPSLLGSCCLPVAVQTAQHKSAD